MALLTCPACGQGRLCEKVEHNWLADYNGVYVRTYTFYAVCDFCGSEIATKEHSLKNKELFLEAKNNLKG